jgi:hypothetical protein
LSIISVLSAAYFRQLVLCLPIRPAYGTEEVRAMFRGVLNATNGFDPPQRE